MQGLDALGVATLDSIQSALAANLPFRPISFSSLTDEDITNLRTLQRLMLLLYGLQQTEDSAAVRYPQLKVKIKYHAFLEKLSYKLIH